MTYSVGQILEKICDLDFVILVISPPLNTIDFFFPYIKITDKRRKPLHFENMKIFIPLEPGPLSYDHRTESYFKGSCSKQVAI